MTGYNQVGLLVETPFRRRLPITLHNLGWIAAESAYVTEFTFQGDVYRSAFKTEKHVDEHCATPDLRFAADTNFLFDELGLSICDDDEEVAA